MKRLPLVLDDTGQIERLQAEDALDSEQVRLVDAREFERLRSAFRLLLLTLIDQGFEVPDELVRELDH